MYIYHDIHSTKVGVGLFWNLSTSVEFRICMKISEGDSGIEYLVTISTIGPELRVKRICCIYHG